MCQFSIEDVQVGSTDATGFDFDQDLPLLWFWDGQIHQLEGHFSFN